MGRVSNNSFRAAVTDMVALVDSRTKGEAGRAPPVAEDWVVDINQEKVTAGCRVV